MNRIRSFLAVCACLIVPVAACGNDDGPTGLERREGGIRVLFVGNSLTYFNNLAGVVTTIARAAGDDGVVARTVAFPDFAIEDHLAEGTAERELRGGKWEYVVMQQGPSSLPENQLLLANGARAIAPLIRGAGAVPVLYMVWPDATRRSAFPAVQTAYRNAAAAVDGLFAPAGDAWMAAWELDPSLALYGPDGFHPSMRGTYLAAVVILARLRGLDPVTLPLTIPGIPLTESEIMQLHQAAKVALARNPARPSLLGQPN